MTALERFINTYQQLDKDNLALLRTVYSSDIRFIDPLHQLTGIDALVGYFSQLYENVDAVRFAFAETITHQDKTAITWVMTVRHPRLNGGQDFHVEGISFLHFNEAGQVCYHHDYFDLGMLLYEQLPIVGRMIKTIKGRVTS